MNNEEQSQICVCPEPCEFSKGCSHAIQHCYGSKCVALGECPACVPIAVPAPVPEPPKSRFVEVPITVEFGQARWEIGVGERIGFRYAGSGVLRTFGPTAFAFCAGGIYADASDEDLESGYKRLIVATHAVYSVLEAKDQEG